MNGQIPQAAIKITVDANLAVDVKFSGRQGLILGLVGATDFAKGWLMARYRKINGGDISGGWGTASLPSVVEKDLQNGKPCYNSVEATEVEVSRDEAVDTYLELRGKLDTRLKIISSSPVEQRFKIDPVLIAKL